MTLGRPARSEQSLDTKQQLAQTETTSSKQAGRQACLRACARLLSKTSHLGLIDGVVIRPSNVGPIGGRAAGVREDVHA